MFFLKRFEATVACKQSWVFFFFFWWLREFPKHQLLFHPLGMKSFLLLMQQSVGLHGHKLPTKTACEEEKRVLLPVHLDNFHSLAFLDASVTRRGPLAVLVPFFLNRLFLCLPISAETRAAVKAAPADPSPSTDTQNSPWDQPLWRKE